MDKIERVNVWYDQAGNYLDVTWISKAGNFLAETENDRVNVLVDDSGNLSGFKIYGITHLNDGDIVDVALSPVTVKGGAS